MILAVTLVLMDGSMGLISICGKRKWSGLWQGHTRNKTGTRQKGDTRWTFPPNNATW